MEMMRLSSSSSSSILYSIKKSSLSSYSTFQSTSSSSSSSSSFLLSNSRNLVSSWRTVFSAGRMIPAATRRNHPSIVSASKIDDPSEDSPFPADESFLRNALASMETVYTNRNPTAKAILELVRSADADQICYDHLAYRTFGVNGHGIDSIAKFFLDFGYTQREELRFPAKKLKAFWFSPPASPHVIGGSGVWGPLPRIFISELLVDQTSLQAQEIIRKYTNLSGSGNKHAAFASALGSLTWEKPSHSEFQQLAKESEYAAWTLVNGYAVNHVTVSTHRLKSHLKNIKSLNQFIEENGFKLNSEGGVLKVSPDGLLLQSSTVADSVPFQFCDGITELVPCSYIEFAERLVLPQYKSLPVHEDSCSWIVYHNLPIEEESIHLSKIKVLKYIKSEDSSEMAEVVPANLNQDSSPSYEDKKDTPLLHSTTSQQRKVENNLLVSHLMTGARIL